MNRSEDSGPSRRYTRRPKQRPETGSDFDKAGEPAEDSQSDEDAEDAEDAFVELLWVEDQEERQDFATELRRGWIDFTYRDLAICVRKEDIQRAVHLLEQKDMVKARHLFLPRGTPGGDRQSAGSNRPLGPKLARLNLDKAFLGTYVVGLFLVFFFSAIGLGAVAEILGVLLVVALFAGLAYALWKAFVRYTSF